MKRMANINWWSNSLEMIITKELAHNHNAQQRINWVKHKEVLYTDFFRKVTLNIWGWGRIKAKE